MSDVNWEMEVERRNRDMKRLEDALLRIGDIVRTPTKATSHRTAQDHYQADFDEIRKLVASALRLPAGQQRKPQSDGAVGGSGKP